MQYADVTWLRQTLCVNLCMCWGRKTVMSSVGRWALMLLPVIIVCCLVMLKSICALFVFTHSFTPHTFPTMSISYSFPAGLHFGCGSVCGNVAGGRVRQAVPEAGVERPGAVPDAAFDQVPDADRQPDEVHPDMSALLSLMLIWSVDKLLCVEVCSLAFTRLPLPLSSVYTPWCAW